MAQVQANPGNFAMLAMINSDDQGSKQNGGVYDNVVPGQMVKTFLMISYLTTQLVKWLLLKQTLVSM